MIISDPDAQSAQISQKQDGRNYTYAIMKTTCIFFGTIKMVWAPPKKCSLLYIQNKLAES